MSIRFDLLALLVATAISFSMKAIGSDEECSSSLGANGIVTVNNIHSHDVIKFTENLKSSASDGNPPRTGLYVVISNKSDETRRVLTLRPFNKLNFERKRRMLLFSGVEMIHWTLPASDSNLFVNKVGFVRVEFEKNESAQVNRLSLGYLAGLNIGSLIGLSDGVYIIAAANDGVDGQHLSLYPVSALPSRTSPSSFAIDHSNPRTLTLGGAAAITIPQPKNFGHLKIAMDKTQDNGGMRAEDLPSQFDYFEDVKFLFSGSSGCMNAQELASILLPILNETISSGGFRRNPIETIVEFINFSNL